MTMSCDLGADPGLRKSGKSEGEISKEKSPFAFAQSHLDKVNCRTILGISVTESITGTAQAPVNWRQFVRRAATSRPEAANSPFGLIPRRRSAPAPAQSPR